MKLRRWLLVLVALLAGSTHAASPNIVILLADDVALTNFGAYGGEARMNIDALAARGALLTQFRTSPQCAPSRAMLLTGMDNHRTGLGAIPEVLHPSHVDQPGYTVHLEDGVETIAVRLKREGYRTYMTGKWHLGHGPGDLPNDHGFDRSFVLDASRRGQLGRPALHAPVHGSTLVRGRHACRSARRLLAGPEFLVDRMIDYLGETPGADAPFLAYVAFQAVHIPVQAPLFIAHYDGVYDVGWHAIRAQRHGRAFELGLIPEGAPLGDMHPALRDWASLDAAERAIATRSIEVNAAHARSDGLPYRAPRRAPEGSGRIREHDLRGHVGQRSGRWGTAARAERDLRRLAGVGGLHGDARRAARRSGHDGLDRPGVGERSRLAESPVQVPRRRWRPARATDHVWSGRARRRRIDARSIMPDLMPTLLDMVDANTPAPDARPLTGRSLRPVLDGARSEAYGEDDVYGIEVAGNVGLYRGRYKLTRSLPPMGDGEWRVFDLETDPGETQDLSVVRPPCSRRCSRTTPTGRRTSA